MRSELFKESYVSLIRGYFKEGNLEFKCVEAYGKGISYIVYNSEREQGYEVSKEQFYEIDIPYKKVELTPDNYTYKK